MFFYFLTSIFRKILGILFVYKVYEFFVEREVKEMELPFHIAFILDGNRRYAKTFNLTLEKSYDIGAKKVLEVVEWCVKLGIKEVTLYSLSGENIQRKKEDLEALFGVYEATLKRLLNYKPIHEAKIHIKSIGDLSKLPSQIRDLINELEDRTKNYNSFYVTVCVAYSGRYEILNVMKEVAEKVKKGEINLEDIKEEIIKTHLLTKHLPYPDPDLVVRTSGEKRLSGFLLWQTNYSELFFTDVLWPDFRRIDLLRIIRNYQKRNRRFGK